MGWQSVQPLVVGTDRVQRGARLLEVERSQHGLEEGQNKRRQEEAQLRQKRKAEERTSQALDTRHPGQQEAEERQWP